jgi:hypothetical protein
MKKNNLITLFILCGFASVAQWNTSGTNIYNSNTGNVGIGTTAPGYKLDVVGPINDWKARFQGPDGYITIGPANSSWAHIYTDRPAFIFNQSVYSFGSFSSYNTDLVLQTTGTTRMTINNSSGSVGIGLSNPYAGSRLHAKSNYTSAWTITSEAYTNDRIVGLAHDGNVGMVSTSYLGNSGFSPLELRTSNITRLHVAVDGNVGIGTTAPTLGKIHVAQSSDASDQGIAILNSTGARAMRLWTDLNNSYVYSGATGQANLILNGTGNVGIGTLNPNQKLTVNGTIYGKEVKVDLNVPGPDYVFEKDYKLPSLEEIKSYVDQHKHLPEVPSAKEMEQNGINLSEMNMILLKKVEELTLHVLELKMQNDDLLKRVSQIESKK